VTASGNVHGGNAVNKEFEKFLRTTLSDEKYEQFKRIETDDWLYLMGEFESKKKSFNPKEQDHVNMRFPHSLKGIYESNKRSSILKRIIKTKSLDDAFREIDTGKEITLKRDKITFTSHFFSKFFKLATLKAIHEIKKVIEKMQGETLSCILMVGGFSECILLQQAVKTEFPDIPVVVPVEASTAVLKGAVLYGYYPPVISERIVKYTYGVSGSAEFIPGAHPIEKRVVTDNGVRCKDIFFKHVTRGELVKTGESQRTKLFVPQYRDQRTVKWDICASKLENPRYTTDKDCHVIGRVTLNLSGTDDATNNQLEVSFAFGGTEIVVTAKEVKTGKIVKSVVSFLE
jgi:molecular chaperone DnaK (HSP70)